MKLNILFKDLEILVSNMGAKPLAWKVDKPPSPPKKIPWKDVIITAGISINIDDIKIEENGVLQYQNKQVLLHIKDVSAFSKYGLPKFHFYGCETLKNMKAKGKFKKYIATQRKDGYFIVDLKINNQNQYERNRKEKLLPCGFCLNWYNANYKQKYSKDNFNIVTFFEQFKDATAPVIIGRPDESYNPDSGYSENWKEISYNLRVKYHWTCQQCHIDLKNHKNLLHTHHFSGVKSDNDERNLKALCVKCHSEQPNHEHMKIACRTEILEIEKLRN